MEENLASDAQFAKIVSAKLPMLIKTVKLLKSLVAIFQNFTPLKFLMYHNILDY